MIKYADVVVESNSYNDKIFHYGEKDTFVTLWQSTPCPQGSGGPCVTISYRGKTFGSVEEAMENSDEEFGMLLIYLMDLFDWKNSRIWK